MDTEIEFRPPKSEDGAQVYDLIDQCPPLDTNSLYCNLLQCSHFSDTSVTAWLDSSLVGFISGYQLPNRENTLFVWQVAVSEQARGMGVASGMMKNILNRPGSPDFSFIETTITAANQASWSLFERLADKLNADMHRSVIFDEKKHFNGQHDSEFLVRIGPFN
ncbi:diaminobutyrate acetyltransferase [Gynuella sunshinyii]|uniref:L-2,4-diaminobutyric acid acetyltransferase n=1 Tax=Gynuella sunshinyii YC6258 TaxID=1445510 RepID=A0A0C5VNZ2_9GAMM|nr:diaminobutyrate acetyltransferase [Gynuella sunshinyii]AJQ95118.1 acetyltransferase [Gynuella sunshinyii YC6258]